MIVVLTSHKWSGQFITKCIGDIFIAVKWQVSWLTLAYNVKHPRTNEVMSNVIIRCKFNLKMAMLAISVELQFSNCHMISLVRACLMF